MPATMLNKVNPHYSRKEREDARLDSSGLWSTALPSNMFAQFHTHVVFTVIYFIRPNSRQFTWLKRNAVQDASRQEGHFPFGQKNVIFVQERSESALTFSEKRGSRALRGFKLRFTGLYIQEMLCMGHLTLLVASAVYRPGYRPIFPVK